MHQNQSILMMAQGWSIDQIFYFQMKVACWWESFPMSQWRSGKKKSLVWVVTG